MEKRWLSLSTYRFINGLLVRGNFSIKLNCSKAFLSTTYTEHLLIRLLTFEWEALVRPIMGHTHMKTLRGNPTSPQRSSEFPSLEPLLLLSISEILCKSMVSQMTK